MIKVKDRAALTLIDSTVDWYESDLWLISEWRHWTIVRGCSQAIHYLDCNYLDGYEMVIVCIVYTLTQMLYSVRNYMWNWII